MSLTNRFCGAFLRRRALWFLPFCIVLAIAGCDSNSLVGAKVYPVKGKVLLPDGKPLTSGQIVFLATQSTVTSTANIESDGGFTFKGSAGDGLPEGDYKVRIEPGSAGVVVKGRTAPQGKLPFDGKFTDEDSSGLTATVTSDESKNNFEFKLIPGKPGRNAAESRGGK